MKKVILSLTVFFLLCSITGFAQSEGEISGIVNDTSQKALEGVTVTLLHAKDSSKAGIKVSDKQGRYEFQHIQYGNYILLFTAEGYTERYSDTLSLSAATTQPVKAIQLQHKINSLTTVTVAARKPFIEQKVDRTVVNVDAAVTNAGASALEVLEKSPGVTVDKDGNVSLKGKASVMIMIDGKPSYLSGAELVNLLRNMNANQIDQIELMTNPPAKYDASGNSGIINIKTKKK